MNNLDSLSVQELEMLLVELITKRSAGLISPGEYNSQAAEATTFYHKKLKELNTSKNKNDAYKYAMGIV